MNPLIYKYTLNPWKVNEPQEVVLPRDAVLLDVQVSELDGSLAIWAIVDTDAPCEPVKFWLAYTGSAPPYDPTGEVRWVYHATVQRLGLVHHVFAQGLRHAGRIYRS